MNDCGVRHNCRTGGSLTQNDLMSRREETGQHVEAGTAARIFRSAGIEIGVPIDLRSRRLPGKDDQRADEGARSGSSGAGQT